MSEEGYVTVMDVKNHALCPKMTYLTHVLHLRERVSEAMEYGREVHGEAPIAPLIPRLKPAKILRGLELKDRELKLSGKVDALIITKNNEYIPVEVKWSDPNPSGGAQRHHKAQMAAYALLINRAFNTTVKRAFIFYVRAGKIVELPITNRDICQVKKFLKQIWDIIKHEQEPSVKVAPFQCRNCGYRPYCQGSTSHAPSSSM